MFPEMLELKRVFLQKQICNFSDNDLRNYDVNRILKVSVSG